MELQEILLRERAELDQTWAETRDVFLRDLPRMLDIWSQLSDQHDFSAIREMPDDDLLVIATLTKLALSELLQQTGAAITEK